VLSGVEEGHKIRGGGIPKKEGKSTNNNQTSNTHTYQRSKIGTHTQTHPFAQVILSVDPSIVTLSILGEKTNIHDIRARFWVEDWCQQIDEVNLVGVTPTSSLLLVPSLSLGLSLSLSPPPSPPPFVHIDAPDIPVTQFPQEPGQLSRMYSSNSAEFRGPAQESGRGASSSRSWCSV
jgi:hypothetical protein